jgi:hypothetical protein
VDHRQALDENGGGRGRYLPAFAISAIISIGICESIHTRLLGRSLTKKQYTMGGKGVKNRRMEIGGWLLSQSIRHVPRHARPATEVAATSTKSAFADSLSTFSLRFTANSPIKCLFCNLNLHSSFEFQKSLAAEGRLRKGSLRLAKYAVSL